MNQIRQAGIDALRRQLGVVDMIRFRRPGSPNWARRFRRGDLVQAYDRDPRRGGKPIALIRLTHDPAYQADADMPDSDDEAEGFAWLDEHPDDISRAFALAPGETLRNRFEAWRRDGGYSWVIRFALVRVEPDGTDAG